MEGRPILPDHRHLDVTAPPTFLGLYTQLCLCYSIPDTSHHAAIIRTLSNGLEKLSESFPWIAGQVCKQGDSIEMMPLARTPRLIVKDYTSDAKFPTMADYRAANFPFNMLDESIICPVKTLPGDFAQGSAPIFFVQVNFIVGGVLLTFTAEHSAMDMTGQAQIISLLSKACKGEEFTKAELADGNVDRRTVVKLLEKYTIGPELEHNIKKLSPEVTSEPQQDVSKESVQSPEGDMKAIDSEPGSKSQPECIWAYFGFSNEALTELKAEATKTITTGYISTDDTITAFIWQLVCRARLARLPASTESNLARAVDARRFVGVSKTYIGLLDNMTYHTYSLKELAEAPLGKIASDLRRAIDPKTTQLEYNTRAYATAFVQAQDKSIFGPVVNQQPDRDIALSSWANINSYGLDFGLPDVIGKPECVRRPRLDPVESLMYLMPKDRGGNTAAAVCLRKEDITAVRDDPEFARYVTYIG